MTIQPIVRNALGLIEGVDYIQSEDGFIDWRKMIQPDYLVPNKQVFERNQKPIPESIDGLQDSELLILLNGIKRLARLRGFSKVTYKLEIPNSEYVGATCSIEWIPNFETEGRVMTTGGAADAHPNNTTGFGTNFLAAIAANRSFVRCVRDFLGIEIVGQDEVSEKPSTLADVVAPNNQTSPIAYLEKLMLEKHVSFGELQAKLVNEKVEGADGFTSVADIPKVKLFEIIDRIRKKKP